MHSHCTPILLNVRCMAYNKYRTATATTWCPCWLPPCSQTNPVALLLLFVCLISGRDKFFVLQDSVTLGEVRALIFNLRAWLSHTDYTLAVLPLAQSGQPSNSSAVTV